MSTGAWILVAAVGVALVVGVVRLLTDGRFRGTHAVRGAEAAAPEPASVLDGVPLDVDLGERATLLQFSSAFCAPCRAARRTLGEVADLVPGVVHHEVDAEQHLELVRRLGVLRTPTTLVLDAAGAEVARASGAPKRGEVLATLARVTPA